MTDCKYNIFRKILNDLPEPKNQLIADDPKNQKIADNMSSMLNWMVVQSRSDSHPIYGYPMGKVLCRCQEEAEEYIANSEFTDCYFKEFND